MAISQGGFSVFAAAEKERGEAGWDLFKALSKEPTPVAGAAQPGWERVAAILGPCSQVSRALRDIAEHRQEVVSQSRALGLSRVISL